MTPAWVSSGQPQPQPWDRPGQSRQEVAAKGQQPSESSVGSSSHLGPRRAAGWHPPPCLVPWRAMGTGPVI